MELAHITHANTIRNKSLKQNSKSNFRGKALSNQFYFQLPYRLMECMDSLSAPEQKEKWFISKNTHDERDGKPSPDLIDKLSLKLITAH